MNSALFLSILVHSIGDEKKKSLHRKQVRLRQTYVKQIKVLQSICHRKKKTFSTISNDLWLIIT